MTEADWNFADAHFLSYVLAGTEAGAPPLYLVLNVARAGIEVTLPQVPPWRRWTLLLDTATMAEERVFPAGTRCPVPACAVLVFSATA
jgi:hypothetical protein